MTAKEAQDILDSLRHYTVVLGYLLSQRGYDKTLMRAANVVVKEIGQLAYTLSDALVEAS